MEESSSYNSADARHRSAVPGPQALTESTSGELCAALCEHIAPRLPKFPDPESDREVTFKRFLLNNCQDEFERSVWKEKVSNKMALGMEAMNLKKEKQEDLKVGARCAECPGPGGFHSLLIESLV